MDEINTTMIDRDTLRQFDESFGTSMEDAGASGDDAPNGANLAGAVKSIERVLEQCDEFGLTYSELPEEKQTELDEAVEDLRYHLKKLSNITADTVGKDTSFELPNGNSVDLPGNATAAGSNSADLPDDPRGNSQS